MLGALSFFRRKGKTSFQKEGKIKKYHFLATPYCRGIICSKYHPRIMYKIESKKRKPRAVLKLYSPSLTFVLCTPTCAYSKSLKMSAPNAKAVQGNNDAHFLLCIASYLFVPKKIQRGSIVINKATGPTIAARFALEKKAAMKNAKPAVAKEKNKMKKKR
mmetsp:Transcript_4872/g.7200  ORF Transcript_4872/g.7200 Transcript_4872/m.7200 type:complete len:160 (+) Transcript_4872:1692-2171(+)